MKRVLLYTGLLLGDCTGHRNSFPTAGADNPTTVSDSIPLGEAMPFLSGETPPFTNTIKGYEYQDTIEGDFNGDGRTELAWHDSSPFECQERVTKKDCRGYIHFSDKGIPTLVIDYFPFGLFVSEGNLNEDGRDEIGVLPGWFFSSCRDYHLFTLKGNKWVEPISPISTTEGQRAKGVRLIEKAPGKKGYITIRYSGDCCCACECTKEKTLQLKL